MLTATCATSRSYLDLFRARGLPTGLVGHGENGSDRSYADAEAVGDTNGMGYMVAIKTRAEMTVLAFAWHWDRTLMS